MSLDLIMRTLFGDAISDPFLRQPYWVGNLSFLLHAAHKMLKNVSCIYENKAYS